MLTGSVVGPQGTTMVHGGGQLYAVPMGVGGAAAGTSPYMLVSTLGVHEHVLLRMHTSYGLHALDVTADVRAWLWPWSWHGMVMVMAWPALKSLSKTRSVTPPL